MNIEKIRKILEENKKTIKSLADISNIIQAIVALFTIVGIGFVGLQYLAQQKTSRQQKAFELYQQFNSENFLTIRNELKEDFYEFDSKEYRTVAAYFKLIKPIWTEPNQYVKIISMTNFFEQVATCVDKKLCDKEATIALFRKEAEEFLQTHYPFFCFERINNGNEDLGMVLEEFLKRYSKKEKSRNCDEIKKHLEQEEEMITNNVEKFENTESSLKQNFTSYLVNNNTIDTSSYY